MNEWAQRLTSFRERLKDLPAEGALLTALPNIRYFSGFTGSNAMMLITKDRAVLFTDPRYALRTPEGMERVIAKGPLERVAAKECRSLSRVGFENQRIEYEKYRSLESLLKSDLVPLNATIEHQRMKKSDWELETIRGSVAINSKAFETALREFRAGITEERLAARIEYEMRCLGAEGPSFDTIVAFGPNSASPHAQPGPTPIGGNGILLVDMGALRGGYASDMTRCMHLGRPAAKTRRMYRAVLGAQLAAIDAVRPGATTGKVDRAARRVLEAHGLGESFSHSTGHGLGLEIHELPRIGNKDKTVLEAGMAITIEPGAYIEGLGGIRIEDTVVVTASGCEVLTPTKKDFTVL